MFPLNKLKTVKKKDSLKEGTRYRTPDPDPAVVRVGRRAMAVIEALDGLFDVSKQL
jgi:hypothetical protein